MVRGHIYAVVDTLAQDILGGIFEAKHDAIAVRIFTEGIDTPNTQLNRHPQDFELRCLGTVNDDLSVTGTIPQVVLKGSAYAASRQG